MNAIDLENLRKKEIELSCKIKNYLKELDATNQCEYLQNVDPKKSVDYIFITLEPSFGRWAQNEKNAKEMINRGFRNFLWSKNDIVFHFSIHNFLSKSYYITDISKVAVSIKLANETRKKVYPLWIDHLKDEIRVIGKKEAKLFFVGNTVGKYLIEKFDSNRIAGKIIHYSSNAGKKRKEARSHNEIKFNEFFLKYPITEGFLLEFAEKLLTTSISNEILVDEILKRLKQGTFLTESRKELIYTYYIAFETCRNHFPVV